MFKHNLYYLSNKLFEIKYKLQLNFVLQKIDIIFFQFELAEFQ